MNLSGTANSVYLDYVFGLNYWNLNTLYLLLIVGGLVRLHFKFIFVYMISLGAFTPLIKSFLFQRELVEPLYVGTVVIHPLLFYCSLIFISLKLIGYNFSPSFNTLPVRWVTLVYILILTLVLGGFWGFQSTVWGYFWVNDTIEWLLAFVLLYILFKIHQTQLSDVMVFALFPLVVLLNLIFVVRLNLLPTRHSFIQNTNIFFYIVCFYYSVAFYSWQYAEVSLVIVRMRWLVLTALIANLLCLKVIVTVYVVFLLFRIHSEFFKKTLWFHLIFVCFFLIWNIYFVYFQIHYTKLHVIFTNFSSAVNGLTFANNSYTIRGYLFKDLEGVVFGLGDSATRSFNISANLSASLALSNYQLLYVFFWIFL